MLYVILCFDCPGRQELRQATRPAHLAFLESIQSKLVEVGPQLDLEGHPCGSMLLVEATDRAEAEAIAASDPYAKAGLFETTLVRGFRSVFRNGQKVG